MRDVELFLRLLAARADGTHLPDLSPEARMDVYLWLMRCSTLAGSVLTPEAFFSRLQ